MHQGQTHDALDEVVAEGKMDHIASEFDHRHYSFCLVEGHHYEQLSLSTTAENRELGPCLLWIMKSRFNEARKACLS